MRVSAEWDGEGPPTSCEEGMDGEVEDYTINVIPNVTITTGTISPLSYCPGSSVSVPYTITGTFNAGNVFTAQLSDASGSFASPSNIGTLSSTSAGTISATISGSQAKGTGYRIRVVSNDPVITGSDNGSDIAVDYPDIITSPGSQCKYGETVDVTVSASSSLTGTFRWYDSAYNWIKTDNSVSSSSYDANGISATTTYYVTFEAGGCTTPYTEVKAYAIIPPSLDASAGGSFCVGTPINLYSEGSYDNIYWEGPDGFYSLEEDPVISNATTDMSGTYTVYTNTLSNVNLVTNGDFEDGNVGFSSSYTYHDSTEVVGGCYASAPLGCEGTYSVVKSPRSVHPNFYLCGDKTSGNGFQMVINGAATAGIVIWSQTVNVVPNTYYQFSYWVQTVELGNVSQLQLFVNGDLAGPIYTASTSTCEWTQFFYNWDSGVNNLAELSLINQRTATGGNDFALDDIVFQHTCTAEASVEVYVSAGFTPEVTITASPSNEVCEGTEVTFTANPLHGGATPSYRWFKNGILETGETNNSYTRSNLNNDDDIQCEMTSSLTGCLTGSAIDLSNEITMTLNPLPTISTAGTIASVRNSTSSQTTTLAYTATTQSPTSYSIDWDATANTAGLTDQGSTAFSFAAGGGTLTGIAIPANVPDNVTPYNGTMTITNANGCSATQEVTITVLPATIISTHPNPLTLCEGNNGSFTVVSTEPTATFQWQYSTDLITWFNTNGEAGVSGHTSDELTITGALLAYNAYYFKCLVTEGAYTEETTSALLTVNPNAQISLSSAVGTDDQTICLGDAITDITYDITGGGTGAGVSGLPAGVSGSFSGGTFTISGTPTGDGVSNYTVTTTGTCQQATANGTITANAPYATVTSSYTEDCPELIGTQGFQPNNADYDAGATLVTFTVTLNGSTATNWDFDYIIEDATVRLGTEPGGYASPNPQSDSNIEVTGAGSTNLTFFINNDPGNPLTPVLKITRVTDEFNCEDLTDRTGSVNIKAMPVVGAFD